MRYEKTDFFKNLDALFSPWEQSQSMSGMIVALVTGAILIDKPFEPWQPCDKISLDEVSTPEQSFVE